jgi:hypothetical protein
MKKIIRFTAIFVVLVFIGTGLAAYEFWQDKTMSASEVKTKWGNTKLDVKKFKDSTYEEKSKMSYSVMTDKSLIGKTYEEIREIFGPNDGHYFTDTIPAYIIQEGKTHSEETWQLVFKMDKKYRVRDIIIHKNCCDK